MASRKEYEMLFQLNAQLGSNYNSTFKSAQSAVVAMQKEIEDLSKTQSNIASYQKQQEAIEATRKRLEILQQQYDNIQKEMKETGDSSSDLKNKLLAKQLQIDKTTASLEAQKQKLGQYDSALQDAGVNTDDLTKESAKLGTQIDDLKQKQEEAADKANNFGATSVLAIDAIQQALVTAGIAKALQEIYEAFNSCTGASIEFESAMTGVSKTVAMSDDEFAAMSQSIKGMSTEIPETTTELADIAQTAGQLGIAKSNILSFTEVMAELGTATNMTSEEAATMLAQFASITNMNPSDYSRLGSAIVDIGNHFSTTEKNVTDMSQTIAAAASIAGMSEADIVGISAAVTSLGISAENGGTQMTKLISDINSAVSSGKDLDSWASVAGMSAHDFASAWGDNASGALDSFVKGLNRIYESGGDVYGTLSNLGITETRMVTMITSLAKSGTRLTDTLGVANNAWKQNTALQAEAGKRYATTQSQLTMMQNAYNNLKVAIGDNYTPELQKLYTLGSQIFGGLSAFIQQHPALVKAVTAFAGVVGAVTAALAAYVAIAKIAKIVTALFVAEIPGVNVIMGITLGVAALTAGVVALTEANKGAADEAENLTPVSHQQYEELQQLNEEYKKAKQTYGETSYEAQSLKWKIDDLNQEYKSGKETLEEYNKANDELISSYDEMVSSHEKTDKSLKTEEDSVDALINKLAQLADTSEDAAKNQQAVLAIIDALNKQVPGLALSFDDVSKGSGNFLESLKNIAKAQAAQKELSADWSAYVDRTGKQKSLEQNKNSAAAQVKAATEEYNQALKDYKTAFEKFKDNDLYDMSGPTAALDAAKKRLADVSAELTTATSKCDENDAAIKKLETTLQGYSGAQDGAITSGEGFQNAISGITKEVSSLAESYKKAYDSAVESIHGQYEVWDEAAKVVAISAGKINSNLQSQIDYWTKYNNNLAKLRDRSAEISGLSEMLANFADGSQSSVNTIAGMATASDKDLKKMVDNWKKLQDEQKTTAGNLADVQTQFTTSMGNLKSQLSTTVAEMDLSKDAAESAKKTMQGFANGAQQKLPEVRAAYERVAQAGIDAVNKKFDIHSPSRVMRNLAELTWAGFTGGAEAMEPDVAKAMSETAGAGSDAVTAEETQLVALSPQLMTYLSALSAVKSETVSAVSGGGGGYINLTVSPQYQFTGTQNSTEVEQMLRSHDADLKDMVLQIVEDAGIDAKRRSY